jgi:hypothetical protein
MGKYIVRTKGNKTYLFQIGEKTELIGYINYDFILRVKEIPVRKSIKTPHGVKGWIETFYPSESFIKVYNEKGEEVAYLEKSKRCRIDGVYLSLERLSREETVLREEEKEGRKGEREKLENLGLSHSYLFKDSQIKAEIYCFTKATNISTLLYTTSGIKSGIEELLRFLPLAISKRVFEQDFVRKFIAG